MNTIADPYPTELRALDEPPIAVNQDAVMNRAIAAVNRLAQAVEQNTLALLDNRPQPVQSGPAALAPLPPVQNVANKPPCPYHGLDRVAPSTNGKGGFYCQSKAAPGQPANPKGYCTWHT